jgi:hypothetical protein
MSVLAALMLTPDVPVDVDGSCACRPTTRCGPIPIATSICAERPSVGVSDLVALPDVAVPG